MSISISTNINKTMVISDSGESLHRVLYYLAISDICGVVLLHFHQH